MSEGARVRVLVDQLCGRVPGGTGRYAEQLLRALAADRPQGATLDAGVGRACPAVADLPVPVHALHVPGLLLSRLWERGLPPRAASAGVVHAPTLLLPPRSRRHRLVVTVHDVVPWTDPATLTSRGVAFHRRMGERAARDADLVVTPTRVVAAQVREVIRPRCPVVAVPSGVAPPPVGTDAGHRRERLGAREGYVLFVGTAEPRKGLDVLLEAMASPGLEGRRLVVAGPPGWGDVRVEDLARRHGLAGRVLVTGRVDEADLGALYDGAEALAMPSRREGFGFPVLEAMALGVPVVTSDDPALVEVGAAAARAVPVGDAGALAAALGEALDGAGRDEAVRAGRRRALDFTWQATAARMWGLYADVAAGRQSGHTAP